MTDCLTDCRELLASRSTRPATSRHQHFPGLSKLLTTLWGAGSLLVPGTPLAVMKFIDLTGQKFGRLTVIRRAPDLKKGFPRWECLCECGNTSFPRSGDLKSGGNKSCGCVVPEDLTGQTFGKLTALRRVDRPGVSWWECKCECGKVKEVRLNSLKMGHTRSCGCMQKESVTTHGCASSDEYRSEYQSWKSMVRRTTTVKDSAKHWKNYKGRGIKVCDRWRSFENFIADMGKRPSSKHSIDRIDNDGDYCPENCRWVTWHEQARNRRSSHMMDYKGTTKCLIEWAETLGICHLVLSKRMQLGWTVERALETPVRKRRK